MGASSRMRIGEKSDIVASGDSGSGGGDGGDGGGGDGVSLKQ